MKNRFVVAALAAVICSTAFSQSTDTLAKIKSSGNLSLGVRDSSALSFALGNGKYAGFHTEMGERIADDLSRVVGRKITIQYTPVTAQNRIPLVQNGTVDLECGSTTNNATRQKDVDFANTTYVEVVRMAVRADSPIRELKDLNGKTVVTTTGTTSVQTLRKSERAQSVDFKEIMGKDHADSFLLLESGRADAFVMDSSTLAANIAKSKNPAGFRIVGPELSVEPIACMMRKGDEALRRAVNESIARQIGDGSLAKLYDKWFMQPIPPTQTSLNLPMSQATRDAWANPNAKPMEAYAAH